MSFSFNNSGTSNGSNVPMVSSGSTGASYTLPSSIGTNGQVIVSNGTTLNWGAGGGGGGGAILAPGDIVMGSTGTSNGNLTLSADNSIKFDSGIVYKYTETANNIYTLTKNDYFVNCLDGCTIINLPNLGTTDRGLSYIINKGYAGSTVTVTVSTNDTIDGDTTFTLSNLNEKIQIISDGGEKWLLV
jgi:hypothetical protein